MIIIGEKINATRKSIAAALEAHDAVTIADVAVQQQVGGADYLDVNGGHSDPSREVANVEWLVDIVQSHTGLPVCIDSANADAVRAGLAKATQRPILNSISLEKDRLSTMLPVVADNDCMVVALLSSDEGPPSGVDDRLRIVGHLLDKLYAAGKKPQDVIVDVCFLPISTDCNAGRLACEAIAAIRREHPDVHIGGGISNVSFGLPKRRYVNLAMLCQAVYAGMDACIMDPCAEGCVAAVYAAEAAAGRDEFCMGFVTAERQGKLV